MRTSEFLGLSLPELPDEADIRVISNDLDTVDGAIKDLSESTAAAGRDIEALETALGNKVDKQTGKGLSSEDYTTAEKNKLSGIEANANNYTLPTAAGNTLGGVKIGTGLSIDNGVVSVPEATSEASGLMTSAEKIKLAGIEAQANKTIVDSVLSSSSTNPVQNKVIESALGGKVDKVNGKGLSTEDYTTAEKTKLSGVEANANNYVHPTTSGNKHVPSGGASGKILKWSADGTAVWGDETQYSDATTSTHGLMSAEDKAKLNGIEAQANKTVVDAALSSSSTNPVQNKVVNAAIDDIKNCLTPQMYGAKGDGETNDTTAFANLRTAAISTGKTVYIPEGTYIITTFNLWTGARIIGAGQNKTILKQKDDTNTSVFWTQNYSTGTGDYVENILISDLTISGGTTTSAVPCGMCLYGCNFYLERITVKGFQRYGIHVKRGESNWAGKHGYMKDITLFDNEQGNMLYEGETDNNFYNIMAYHNANIEPAFNVKFNSSGCRIFGMHLWGNADISLWSNCFGATYTGCHIEGGKTAKIAVQQRCQFYGEIYHHDNNNTVTAIKALDSLFDCTLDFEARNIYKLFDLNSKWVANNHVRVVADMISDNLFANGRFGVADDVSINWNYNNSRYVYIMNVKNYVDTYNNVNSVFAEINESYYNGTSKVFEIQAGDGQSDDYVSIYPNTGRCGIAAKGNSNNVDLYLSPKGNGAVKFNHTCITGADYDDFVDAGFYEALGDTDHPTQNAPDGNNTSNNFLVLVQNRGNRVVQIASSVRTPVMYQRLIIAGVASDWERITTGAEYTVTPNEFNVWNGESYVSIEQYPKDDIHVSLARDKIIIGNSGEDLNSCVDTTKLYYNWNGNGSDVKYPVHTPSEMSASPFIMTPTFHRNNVLVQKLIVDNAGGLGSTWYRRRTGAGTQEDPFVWEDWQPSGNTFPRHFANKIGANYNDVDYIGVHVVQGTAENSTQNAPDGNNTNNNYVVVNLNPRTGSTYFPQMAYSVRSDQSIYHRCHAGSGGFGPWKKIADEDDIAAITALL